MLSAVITNMIAIGANEGFFKIHLPNDRSAKEIKISSETKTLNAFNKQKPLIADSVDTEFIADAAVCNRMEIQAALLALEKGQTTEVKAIATTLHEYHKKIGSELKKLANDKNYPYSDELSSHCKDDISKLFKLNGQLFEKTYLNLVEENHRKSLAIYKKVIAKSTDTGIRAFAFSVIPQLEAHNASVKLLNKTLRTTSKL